MSDRPITTALTPADSSTGLSLPKPAANGTCCIGGTYFSLPIVGKSATRSGNDIPGACGPHTEKCVAFLFSVRRIIVARCCQAVTAVMRGNPDRVAETAAA